MTQITPEEVIEHQREVYNKIATYFSETRQKPWRDLIFIKTFAEHANTVIDIGCGNGRVYQLFSDLSIRYIGIDQSETQIAIAREKVPHGEFLLAEMCDIPLKDNLADLVVCIAVFHHLPDEGHRLQALSEMRRITKPGAHIIMTNWNLESDWAHEKISDQEWQPAPDGENSFLVPWKKQDGTVVGQRYYHGFTCDELEGLVKKSGLQLHEQYYIKDGARSDKENGDNIVTIMVR